MDKINVELTIEQLRFLITTLTNNVQVMQREINAMQQDMDFKVAFIKTLKDSKVEEVAKSNDKK